MRSAQQTEYAHYTRLKCKHLFVLVPTKWVRHADEVHRIPAHERHGPRIPGDLPISARDGPSQKRSRCIEGRLCVGRDNQCGHAYQAPQDRGDQHARCRPAHGALHVEKAAALHHVEAA